jgi:methionyl-tRNA formyltransferase
LVGQQTRHREEADPVTNYQLPITNMNIIYLGSGEFGIECLDALAESNHRLQLVVTQLPHQAGRGRRPRPTPVARWANTHSLPFIETEDANAPPVIEQIAGHEPDLILVIAFGQKIGPELINLPPPGRAINVHASLLPKYRGAAPINWAIINGESQTGISIITLAERIDAGKILAQSQTNIEPDETAGDLHDRLARMAAPLLLKALKQIEDGTALYTEQDHSKATLAPKLRKSDGFLDFSDPADLLARKIRGFWPWPGASANYVSKKTNRSTGVTLAMANVVETSSPAHLPPGTLDDDLNIICGQSALEITKIKPDGSRLMDFRDFVNGRATQPGDTFVKINN